MKILYTTVFLLLASLVYGQKSTLYQNVNVRAKELKHNLNKTGDNLILKCERTIYEVVIFNDDFERVVRVRDNEAIVPIADLPVGRYIIEVLLSDKLVVITLLRNEAFELPDAAPLISDTSDLFGRKSKPKTEAVASIEKPTEPSVEIKVAAIEETKPEISSTEINTKKTDLAVAGKKATPKPRLTRKVTYTKPAAVKKTPKREISAARANRIVSTYWVEYRINDGSSSQKILKLGDQETVDRMIRKIEIDMKTRAGRLNELIIWTVYDPPKFVQHKKNNKSNFTSIASESFRLEPYYKKVHDPDNL